MIPAGLTMNWAVAALFWLLLLPSSTFRSFEISLTAIFFFSTFPIWGMNLLGEDVGLRIDRHLRSCCIKYWKHLTFRGFLRKLDDRWGLGRLWDLLRFVIISQRDWVWSVSWNPLRIYSDSSLQAPIFTSCILRVRCLTPDLVDLGSSGLLPRFFLCTCHLCCRSRLWGTKSCSRPDWKLFPFVHLPLATGGIRCPSCLGANYHLSSAFYIWKGIFSSSLPSWCTPLKMSRCTGGDRFKWHFIFCS